MCVISRQTNFKAVKFLVFIIATIERITQSFVNIDICPRPELHHICTANGNFTKYEAIYILFNDDLAIRNHSELWRPFTIRTICH